jgi:hypothetical protein
MNYKKPLQMSDDDIRDLTQLVRLLLPCEVVGNHWIYREKTDEDATFYRREDVDKLLGFIADRLLGIEEL